MAQPDRKWHDKATQRLWPIEERARLAFADPANEHAARNRDFFFHAFDTWVGTDPSAELGKLFTAGGVGEGPLPLFSATPDLFGACISRYGTDFSAQETLLLFGVLLARQAGDAIEPEDACTETSLTSERDRRVLGPRQVHVELRRIDREADARWQPRRTRRLPRRLGRRRSTQVAIHGTAPRDQGAIHELEDNSLIRGRIMAFELDAIPARGTGEGVHRCQSSRTARPPRGCAPHEG